MECLTRKISIRALALIVITAFASFAQVPVHINSGDPAFPFPQFLPYAHPNGDTLHNLGSRNPAGVTHAEMERAARDAYHTMMNRAEYASVRGRTNVDGTRYIKFNSNPYCSEGDGYALLAAAMMADKTTFDGLWLHTHDMALNKVTRYGDGSSAPAYSYSRLTDWTNNAGGNSAADGDFDIALALMIAHMNWGDDMGVRDSRGNMISYKEDFLKIARGISDTVIYSNGNYLSGDIGFDGYFKGGDSWAELTGWARNAANLATLPINLSRQVEQPGPTMQHIDYTAPAYFRQFADYLNRLDSAKYAWNIFQYRRAEASSDWLYGKFLDQNQRHIPVIGWVEMAQGAEPAFTNFTDGEDFRAAWRSVLSYVWHGNPAYSWDPSKNMIVRNQSNTHQRDVGMRFSRFLWDRQRTPWNAEPEEIIGTPATTWWGPAVLKYYYSPTGQELTVFPLNWLHGTGSPSAVTAQDFDLMAEMYRQCELEMDVEKPAPPGGTYLDRTPQYFHGFFRLLGMLTLTGNHHAPLNMKRQANMKVYLDVDKTYAFEGDTITYTIDYRNYGAQDADGVVITNRLHNDMVYVSSTGGGAHDPASNTVRWNIGAVPGYKSSMGGNPSQTMGTVTLKVVIPFANLKRYENQVEIACANGTGWVSNGFPNKMSSVMKRNGVDIARRALRGDFSVYRDTVNPGAEVTYTINFENSAEAGWLNGGRPGVNFTYMHNGTQATDNAHTFMLRIYHDAHEPYIDYGNYRISYFMYDAVYKELTGQNSWTIATDIIADQALGDLVTPKWEEVPQGEDGRGKWNQRLIVQVADPETRATDTNWVTMAATTPHLITYYGSPARIARGGMAPYKAVWRMTANYANRNWGADWSFNKNVSGNTGSEAKLSDWGFPITPDFTEDYDPDYEGKPVSHLHRKLHFKPSGSVDNVLIEEWDGYTWRRVFGSGPVPGREVKNVKIVDTLPPGVTFQKFVGANPLGVAPKISSNGRVITWEIDRMLVGEKGKIEAVVRVDTVPQSGRVARLTSRARLSADRESEIARTAVLIVTNDELPCQAPTFNGLTKTANKDRYAVGDTVIYTMAYKQMHGYSETSTSRNQWTGDASNNVSSDGKTITLDGGSARFIPSHGTDVTITGTITPIRNQRPFTIFARNEGSRSVDVEFAYEWAIQDALNGLPGIVITVRSNGTRVGEYNYPFDGEPSASLDFTISLSGDTLRLNVGSASETFTGVAVQAGYAGFRSETKEWVELDRITDWQIRTDAAFDVTIRDTIPVGVTYVSGFTKGWIDRADGTVDSLNGRSENGVIYWDVVKGDAALGGDDAVTVTWKGVVNASVPGDVIVNNAYVALRGISSSSTAIAAQRCAWFGETIVEPPPEGDVFANPSGGIFTGSIEVSLSSDAEDAVIWYTLNGMTPDPVSLPGITRRYTGSPLVFDATTTLKAAAFVDDWELGEITHTYELLRTVPVLSAVYYNEESKGLGLAHGVKLILPPGRGADVNREVVQKHTDLIELAGDGMPNIASMRFEGDTVVLVFGGNGIRPPSDARVSITLPNLPSAQYTSAHGYLSEGSFNLEDNVSIRISYVPVLAAIFYDDVGDGKAHGVKLALPQGRGGEVNEEIVRKHSDLITLDGMPSVASMRFDGDTITLVFAGGGIEPFGDARLVVKQPELGGTNYTIADGYLSETLLAIIDGVAPVLIDAVYYPSLAEDKTSPVSGDTLALTFNKYARVANADDAVSPFIFTYDRGEKKYDLSLQYARQSGNTFYFIVLGVGGSDPVEAPSQGDMVRIKPTGEVENLYSYAQYNENNTAVPLRISYGEDLDVRVTVGPNPFKASEDSLRIFISVVPNIPAIFNSLDPEILIFDKMGNIVAKSGENLNVETVDGRYAAVFNGRNRKGRAVGAGTYMVRVTYKNQEGKRQTVKRLIYVL